MSEEYGIMEQRNLNMFHMKVVTLKYKACLTYFTLFL